jgi:hypothetical protein
MNEWRNLYNISDGDATIKLVNKAVEKYETKASVQIDTDPSFNGTTTTARLVQSNDFNRDISNWHPLPEAPLVLLPGLESALLSTFSFTARYLAVEIIVGDATAGILNINSNYTK